MDGEKIARDRIAEAITETFGERCSEYAPLCPCCQAWKQYDALMPNPVPTPDTDPMPDTYGELWDGRTVRPVREAADG